MESVPIIRNNICINADPDGCARNVLQDIDYVRRRGNLQTGPGKVLIIGSSSGFGLASRITAAFACGSATIGIAYEREERDGRPGTPGWYNTRAFDETAARYGLHSVSINGDAFSHEIKRLAADAAETTPGKIDLVIYSLASPFRKDPDTGTLYRSVLKPIGRSYTARSLDFLSSELKVTTIEPAVSEEIEQTRRVMGGDDWKLWIGALLERGLLARNALTVAYSYIGPEVTYPVYREGTIGRAKEDLERTAAVLTEKLRSTGGRALISVNKALVTRASAVIPVVPLYISLLYKVMKSESLHEGCIEQMYRLFSEKLYQNPLPTDPEGRIRMDDWEMKPSVQSKIRELWESVNPDNVKDVADIDGYRSDFMRLHGFGVH